MTQVLLVEDEVWLGESYMKRLVAEGYEVRWCRDGYEAIGLIDEERPDVIVLDLLLPWANGLQLLHELASHADLVQIPVIICSSALPQGVTVEQLRHYGVRQVLDKTRLRPRDLVAAVKGVYADVSD